MDLVPRLKFEMRITSASCSATSPLFLRPGAPPYSLNTPLYSLSTPSKAALLRFPSIPFSNRGVYNIYIDLNSARLTKLDWT